MTVELLGESRLLSKSFPDRSIAPEELIVEDVQALCIFRNFLRSCNVDGRFTKGMSPEEQANSVAYPNTLVTGYTDFGDLVHLRNQPTLMDEQRGYAAIVADLHGEEPFSPAITGFSRYTNRYMEPVEMIYFEDKHKDCDRWPEKHHPRVYHEIRSAEFTLMPGGDRAADLVKPIEELIQKVEAALPTGRLYDETLGNNVLRLVGERQ